MLTWTSPTLHLTHHQISVNFPLQFHMTKMPERMKGRGVCVGGEPFSHRETDWQRPYRLGISDHCIPREPWFKCVLSTLNSQVQELRQEVDMAVSFPTCWHQESPGLGVLLRGGGPRLLLTARPPGGSPGHAPLNTRSANTGGGEQPVRAGRDTKE